MKGIAMRTTRITQTVITAAMEVHRQLGPACAAAEYGQFLRHELHIRGVRCRTLASPAPCSGRSDIVIGDDLMVEVVASEEAKPAQTAQLALAVHRGGAKEGLLVNFLGPVLAHQSVRRNR